MDIPGSGFLVESDVRETVLAVLAFTTFLLFLLSAGFAVYTIFLRVSNDRRAARWKRLEASWEPAVLDVLGGTGSMPDLLARIPPEETLLFLDYLLRLATRVRGKDHDTLAELARPLLGALDRRTREGDLTQRARAVRTLGALGMRDHAPAIIAALTDPAPLVAMVAARALAKPENAQYMVHVLAHLDRFEQWSRSFLCAMLVAVGPEAAAAIRGTLSDRSRPARIRAIAADALRQLRDPAAADTAVEVLAGESDRNLVTACLRLLGSIGVPSSRAAVLVHCTSPDDVVRGAALSALARVGNEADFPTLRTGMEDVSPWVAIQAARGLRDGGDRAWLQGLADAKHPRSALALQVLAEGRK